MAIPVNNIKKNFNKVSISYDYVGKIQKSSAAFLINKVLNFKNFTPQTILDVGTELGTFLSFCYLYLTPRLSILMTLPIKCLHHEDKLFKSFQYLLLTWRYAKARRLYL
ncbi:hypothetical protein HE1_00508 [Holospora elegans E1]|uniref:Uncharacterized protein n=1 Tax=Holospora elegans E1 TaxID=1427503 RepID=A0A023DXM4_9PROT|nr:hypothetical protein [Holospora elegans]GAJ46183.1 hypothetical protein HE1_00508 [Holospora elegans E1]